MEPIRIAAVGDIMCGESFYQYRRGPRTHIDQLGPAFLDPDVRTLFQSHDVVFGNLECVLSDQGYRPGSLRSHHLRGRPECAALLREWGFSLLSVANNHILEHGRDAACDTVRRLQGAGLTVVGAGRGAAFEPGCETVELTVRGVRVGALAGCLLSDRYAFDGGGALDALLVETRALAARCNIILVSLHWGNEYMDCPAAGQREIARAFADAGATLLLGHHPHVVQGVELISGCFVAYSLGNFIFDQILPETRWSAILCLEVEPGKPPRCTAVPVRLDPLHRPMLAGPPDTSRLTEELRVRNQFAAAMLQPVRYAALARRRERESRRRRALYIARSVPGFPASYVLQLMFRPVLRRLKRW